MAADRIGLAVDEGWKMYLQSQEPRAITTFLFKLRESKSLTDDEIKAVREGIRMRLRDYGERRGT